MVRELASRLQGKQEKKKKQNKNQLASSGLALGVLLAGFPS